MIFRKRVDQSKRAIWAGRGIYTHRVAHIPTAALSAICLQFLPCVNVVPKLCHNGDIIFPPAAFALPFARKTGKYRLRAVQDR